MRRDEHVQRADPAARQRAPPRRRIRTSNLDLEPALGGILADYTQFARLAVGTNIVSHPTSNGSACANVSLKPAPLWPGNRTRVSRQRRRAVAEAAYQAVPRLTPAH